jgi:glycosyltransferase involved in cell wall biosynthesis
MKLLIDARTVRPGMTGVGTYTEEFVRALDGFNSGLQIEVLTLEGATIEGLPRAAARPVRIDYESHPAGEWFMHFQVPALLRRERFDAFWGPAFMVPWVRTSASKVVTIHDLTAFTLPGCYPRAFAQYLRVVTRLSIAAADRVICDSRTVADEVIARFKVSAPRVAVVYPGVSSFFSPAAANPTAGGGYVLAIGGGTPRKNDAFLLAAWEEAVQAGAGGDLVFVSARPSEVRAPRVRFTPWQSREQLRELYRNAALFVLPSLYEGFGFTALEAMACGCPVAVSCAGALPEVCGDAAVYFDPRDVCGAGHLLAETLGDAAKLRSLREKGLARAASFTWEKAARQMIEILNETTGTRHA